MVANENDVSSATVFVVDDDDHSLCYFQAVLQGAGMVVETFLRANDFLRRLRPEEPGCLLLDVRMPEISGLELQQRLTQLHCPMPIILISGDADVESCSQAFRAGAFDFVEKSISDQELIALTRRAVDEAMRLQSLAEHRSRVQALTQRLTAREKVVKGLMLEGLSIKEIAYSLDIAFQTAAKHRARVLRKMKVESDAELIRLETAMNVGYFSENAN